MYNTSTDNSIYKSKGVTLARSGFDKSMLPVFTSKINEGAVKLTGVLSSIQQDSANDYSNIHRAANYSYIENASGQDSTWSWTALDIHIPKEIAQVVDVARSLLGTITSVLNLVKETLQAVSLLTSFVTDALKAVIDSLVETITQLLSWFTVDAKIHILPVPPIVPKVPRPAKSAVVDLAKSVVDSANESIKLTVSGSNSSIVNTESSVAGNKGFYNKVVSKLNDKTDYNRPLFSESDYVAGVSIILGYPLERLLGMYYKILSVLDTRSRVQVEGLPKPRRLISCSYSPNSKIVSLEFAKLKDTKRIILVNSKYSNVEYTDYILMYSKTAKFNDSPELKRRFYETLYSDGALKAIQVLRTNNITYADHGIDLVSVAGSSFVSSEFSGVYNVNYSNIANPDVLDVMLVSDIRYTDSTTNSAARITVTSNVITMTVYSSGKLIVSSGSGKYPNWVQIGSVFDLIPALGLLRDSLIAIKSLVLGFISSSVNILKSIIEELVDYISYITEVLARIDVVLQVLRDLANLGVGASMLMFQGLGGNNLLSAILKDGLITQPGRSSNIGDSVYTSPVDLSTSGDIILDWKRSTKKLYSSINRSISNFPESISFDSTASYGYGNVPPRFDDLQSVAGVVIVGGSENVDNTMQFFKILKMLLAVEDDKEFVPEAEDISQAIPIGSSQPAALDLGYIDSSSSLPGGYDISMKPAENSGQVLEDYCSK